jgi:hypothetical protein
MAAPVPYSPERMPALCHTFAVFDHWRRRSTHTDSLRVLPVPILLAMTSQHESELVERIGGAHQDLGLRARDAVGVRERAERDHRAGRSDEAMVHLKQAAALFAEIGGDADEMHPAVWMLVEW